MLLGFKMVEGLTKTFLEPRVPIDASLSYVKDRQHSLGTVGD